MDAWNQAIQDFLSARGWTTTAMVRLCMAAALGGIIGLEREVRGRQAGFRTNLLVCLGSALVMLVSNALAEARWAAAGAYNINVDPGRIAYGVMTGIGFLGAGAIIKHNDDIHGLTTAAGLWCVAAVGLAIGLGLYILAILAAALVILALWLLHGAEGTLRKRQYRRIVIRCPWAPDCIAAVVDRLRAGGVMVIDQSFHRLGDLTQVDIELYITFLDPAKYNAIEADFYRDQNWQLISSVRS